MKKVKDKGIGRIMYVAIELTKNYSRSMMTRKTMNKTIRSFEKFKGNDLCIW